MEFYSLHQFWGDNGSNFSQFWLPPFSTMCGTTCYFQDADDAKGMGGKKSLAVKALNQNVLLWAGFFAASLFVYFVLSGGDFSFLMTYGAMSRMFGFGVLNVKIYTGQRVTGVSLKTLQLYGIVFVMRLSSIFRHEGYLPYDKSGDWLYHLIEFLALCFTGSALFCVVGKFKSSYQQDFDKFGEMNVPPGAGAVYLAVPIAILAILIHPNLNSDFMSDFAWTYAMYLESAALVPQLFMFQRQKTGVVELMTAHFVFALGFGRLLEFAFWVFSYHELSSSGGSKLPGYIAVFSIFLQLVLMLDFFYYYYLAMKNATPLVLPSHNGMGMV
mmetsp:Transcript_5714/g.8423  ORF Transcript_5714/g.8423 Transcript_5714/m.8423 type:complete len:328 (-) Transcript_5714:1023-2006(-)